MMRDKPYLVKYNVFALYKAGYYYNFLFNSLKSGFPGLLANSAQGVLPDLLNNSIMIIIKDLSKTSRAVLYLILLFF